MHFELRRLNCINQSVYAKTERGRERERETETERDREQRGVLTNVDIREEQPLKEGWSLTAG